MHKFRRVLALVCLTLMLPTTQTIMATSNSQVEVYNNYSIEGDVVDSVTERKFITYVNDSLVSKKDVIEYWLIRLDSRNKIKSVQTFIESEPSNGELLEYAIRLKILMARTNLNPQAQIDFVREHRHDLITYRANLDDIENPRFNIHSNIETLVEENFRNVNTRISDTEIIESVRTFKVDELSCKEHMYKSLVYSDLAIGITNPIPLSDVDVITTSKFGARGRLFIAGNDLSNHTGIDLGMPTGTEIVAAQSGKVVKSTYSDCGYGNHIMIDHGGYYTLYGHCSDLQVFKDDIVEQGQVIAEVGSSGWSTGPHLHFEIISNGKPIDPYPYLKKQEEF